MWQKLLQNAKDIIYPKTCVICKEKLNAASSIDDLVCLGCWMKIRKNPPPFCFCCGRHLETHNWGKNICRKCQRQNFYFDRAFSPFPYEGPLKELIHEFKYKGKDYLGKTLSKPMVEFIKEYDLPMDYMDCIMPVPLHKTRLREREFNQALVLAENIALEFEKEVVDDNLFRHRLTRTQTELQEEMRFLNVRDSFSVKEPGSIKGKNILLVDDVLTTAATASFAANTLKNAGANIVFVLTLAN